MLLSFIHELIKKYVIECNLVRVKNLEKKGEVLLQINDVGYTITPFCGVDLLPFLSKVYCGYNYTLTWSIFSKLVGLQVLIFLYMRVPYPFPLKIKRFIDNLNEYVSFLGRRFKITWLPYWIPSCSPHFVNFASTFLKAFCFKLNHIQVK